MPQRGLGKDLDAGIGSNQLYGQNTYQSVNQCTHGFRSFSRSRKRFGAGIKGVRLRVQAP